jgi:MFS family permease
MLRFWRRWAKGKCQKVLFGWISDKIRSRRIPYLFGLVLLAAATVLFALAPNLTWLLIARALQGAATSIVFTIGYTMMFDKVGSKGLGRALGYASLAMSLGWFLGPVVGGLIYAHAGYLAVFSPAIGLIAVEILLRVLMVEDRPRAIGVVDSGDFPPSDDGGEIGETTPLLRSEQLSTTTQPSTNAMFVLMSSPRLVIGISANCILCLLTVSADSVLPVFIKDVFDFDSSQVALVFLCLLLPMMFSPLFGTLAEKVGIKLVSIIAFSIAVPTLYLLRYVEGNTTTDLAILVVLLFILGISFALGMPALSLEIVHVVEEIEERNRGIFGPHGAIAQAYGISTAAQGIGMATGPIAAGFLKTYYGWSTMTTVLALLSLVALVLVVPLTGGRLFAR